LPWQQGRRGRLPLPPPVGAGATPALLPPPPAPRPPRATPRPRGAAPRGRPPPRTPPPPPSGRRHRPTPRRPPRPAGGRTRGLDPFVTEIETSAGGGGGSAPITPTAPERHVPAAPAAPCASGRRPAKRRAGSSILGSRRTAAPRRTRCRRSFAHRPRRRGSRR